jgi:hypothetical protein
LLCSAAKAVAGGEAIVCGLGPESGIGIGVTSIDEGENVTFELLVDWWTPRLICLLISWAKKRST